MPLIILQSGMTTYEKRYRSLGRDDVVNDVMKGGKTKTRGFFLETVRAGYQSGHRFRVSRVMRHRKKQPFFGPCHNTMEEGLDNGQVESGRRGWVSAH